MKNNRTFLEKLLNGAEVEWKLLSLVSEMQRGKTITAKSTNEGKIPVISGGQKPAYYHSESNRDGKTITVAGSGAYAGYIMYWEEPIFVSDAFSIKTDESLLQIKYVYHFLLQNQQKIYAMKKGSGVPHVYPKDIGTLTIPIPPLSVQTEIVKILDALTALTSELTSELILRRKQYEYYREKLLSEEELGKVGFEWKPLGEVTNIKTGQAVSKYSISQNPGIYPVINSGREPLGFINEWNTENDPIGITTRGAGVGSITWQEGKYFRGNLNYSVTVKSDYKLNIRFLYHILLHFQKEIHNLCSFTGIPALNASELKKLEISIPAIEEQQRIVSILDKFETLTNSITEGLPLAIEQSQKRYEYYRELLLNFPGRE
ncbi:TPA: restriction endonuclease subunit S [Haemophilus influenzae]|uniref:restriction endonuclease subunit S n=1 Tax=Haemophilus influenzae TaxID=727 RepID=UPI000E3466EC|nr:restriction endonuclease subunit S [Haemophilus influenzae]MCK8934077.1 restriction endonuclease subunit S [Haemophilus influenzae]MCK9072966.1 restriction endonuclease subunit S [Haemophilus influenzae]MCK9076663.1 restriction endonuclease subunit S [Haemophilus influenzae]RFO84360.1 restriction endonuclease subunit S [Haemophilus influenzae]